MTGPSEPEICPKCGSSDVVAGDCRACEEVRKDLEADEASDEEAPDEEP